MQEFHVHLKDHLLACWQGVQHLGEDLQFSDDDHNTLLIAENKMYEHKIL